jgi:hypothetical protein
MRYGCKAPRISNQGQVHTQSLLLVYLRLAEPQNQRGCRGEQKYLNTQAGINISTIHGIIAAHNPAFLRPFHFSKLKLFFIVVGSKQEVTQDFCRVCRAAPCISLLVCL